MTDPRIDALRDYPHFDGWRKDEKEGLVAIFDAADSAAGYVRIDLNDEALLARLADAIEVPQMYVDGDDRETWLEWQQRAIRAALRRPE